MIPITSLENLLRREWLETNGIGGFASSTPIGLHTRRYHGLLFAATRPPVGRTLLLSNLEETLIIDGQRYPLSANRYGGGTLHPEGFCYLTLFTTDPFPTAVYEADGITLTRTLLLVQDEDTLVVLYEASGIGEQDCTLEVRPLTAFRDYHALTRENTALHPVVQMTLGGVCIAPYAGVPELYIAHDAEGVDTENYWFRNFEYLEERNRGFDAHEDLWSPFGLRFDLRNRDSRAALIASTKPTDVRLAWDLRDAERKRRTVQVNGKGKSERRDAIETLAHRLTRAADSYLVSRETHETVIAGYHWFGDWGRDTMISLPGLTLVTGRYEAAKGILLAFADHISDGMIPNRFPDAGETPEYNTIDGTRWYFEAVRALLSYTGDYDWVRANLYDRLNDIIRWHLSGTRYGIKVDTDGLLMGGASGVQLTWMDARVNGRVITPREGKPVEIQALWYNALCVMESLARAFDDTERAAEYGSRADLAQSSFDLQFWNPFAGCLYDCIGLDEAPDIRIRPNQVLATSLGHPLVSGERARLLLKVVERDLLTPVGLRSLSPADPAYCGRYEGDGARRDSAYHQGTVWPWLLGPYISGYVRAYGRSKAALSQAREWLSGFAAHLDDAGIGHISEIFDGDPPHTPRGCIAQAWSVGEVLRTIVEDVLDRRPDGGAPCEKR